MEVLGLKTLFSIYMGRSKVGLPLPSLTSSCELLLWLLLHGMACLVRHAGSLLLQLMREQIRFHGIETHAWYPHLARGLGHACDC